MARSEQDPAGTEPDALDADAGAVGPLLLDMVARDRAAGVRRSLEDYQALFEGHESLIADLLERLDRTDDDEGDATVPAGGGSRDVAPGTMLGPYRVEEEIGRGGQGHVFRATDTRMGRTVAVKVLRFLTAIDEQVIERFRREAEAAARCDHPGIVAVYDIEINRGIPYIAMQFVEGASLRARIAAAFDADADTPTVATRRTFLEIVEKTARALQAMHEVGVVHRDVKPGNIQITPDGSPILMDFGLAFDESSETHALTLTGDAIGTPAYMSPEQLTAPTSVDARTDVWSLGVTLYECLTGQRPFDAPTRARLDTAIQSQDPVDPRRLDPTISRDLATVVMTALKKERDLRYSSAASFADDLRAVVDKRPVTARPVGPVQRLVRWGRREPVRLALVTLSFLAFAGASVWVADAVKTRQDLERRRTEAAGFTRFATRVLDDCDVDLRNLADVLERFEGAGVDQRVRFEAISEAGFLTSKLRADWGAAGSQITRALLLDPESRDARGALARLGAQRLRHAYLRAHDVTEPANVRVLAAQLRADDREDAYADLLIGEAAVTIKTSPAGAAVRVLEDGRRRALGTTPLRTSMATGSYVIELVADGFAPARLPLVVRPPAASHAPWESDLRTIDFDFEHANAYGPDWVFVPAGWSLVGDPPRWQKEDEFYIQRREVSIADWVLFLNSKYFARLAKSKGSLEEFVPQAPNLHQRPYVEKVKRRRATGEVVEEWEPAHGVDPEWPVTAIDRGAMEKYASWLNEEAKDHDDPRFVALPFEAQWERAARGADGRAFPWGPTFDWADHGHLLAAGPRVRRVPVGSTPVDVSPFGVRDLASSVSEITLSRKDESDSIVQIVRGGSFVDDDPDGLRTTRRRPIQSSPEIGIGFRLVKSARRIVVPGGPVTLPFLDEFRGEPHGSWLTGVGLPGALRSARSGESVASENGSLILQGGLHSFSQKAFAVLPVEFPGSDYRVGLVVRVSRQRVEKPEERGFHVFMSGSLAPTGYPNLRLSITHDGVGTLAADGKAGTSATGALDWTEGTLRNVEIRVAGGRAELRVWGRRDERPEDPDLSTPIRSDAPPPRWLDLRAENLVGMKVQLFEVSVTPDDR